MAEGPLQRLHCSEGADSRLHGLDFLSRLVRRFEMGRASHPDMTGWVPAVDDSVGRAGESRAWSGVDAGR